MNIKVLEQYLKDYKNRFSEIHDMEIYKWKAVKQFQDNFNVEASNFHDMLTRSLSKTSNLMDSGQYFPRRMILWNAEKSPEKVRILFQNLYDQSLDFIERVEEFSRDIKKVNIENFKNEKYKDYQDHRAIIVYLNLRFPEENYFYKYAMFKKIVDKLDYDYKPKIGRPSNFIQFYSICEIIKEYIVKDDELIRMHQRRLGNDDYSDYNLNILTQDVIYAISNHLDLDPSTLAQDNRLEEETFELSIRKKEVMFYGAKIDYSARAKTNQRIGDLGELLVLKHEKKNVASKYLKKVVHVSKTIGDGLGYDIESVDKNGDPKFIEVKTTRGGEHTPFYITAAELRKSQIDAKNYFLYRVYNFDDKNNAGSYFIIEGDLTKYCENPVQYEVLPDRK